MQTARIFSNGNTKTVSLPKDFRFDDEEVVIKKLGDRVVLLPKRYRAESLMAMLLKIGPLEIERQQPEEPQERSFESEQ